jgi:hypothetical protein
MDEDRDQDCGPVALSYAALRALAAIQRTTFAEDEILLWALVSAAWPSWRALSQ